MKIDRRIVLMFIGFSKDTTGLQNSHTMNKPSFLRAC